MINKAPPTCCLSRLPGEGEPIKTMLALREESKRFLFHTVDTAPRTSIKKDHFESCMHACVSGFLAFVCFFILLATNSFPFHLFPCLGSSHLSLNRDWPTPKPTRHALSAPTCPATSSRTAWSTLCLLSPRVSACSPSEASRAPTTSTPAASMATGQSRASSSESDCEVKELSSSLL